MAIATRFGVFVPQGWRMDLVHIEDPVEQYEAMSRVAQEAERLGFDSIWLYDHFHTIPNPEVQSTFEAWIATAALARDTRRIRIGQMVTCNGYRNPAYLAKVASTVDVLSNGRLDFGIGAGWYEHEWLAYGYGFPDAPTRLKMLREALQIIKAMWTEPYANFEGKFYQVKGAINEPKGVQKPHPPIWIGGGGEKVTLKLVAQYGDVSNFAGNNIELFRHKADILRAHCDAIGRNYDDIIKSVDVDALVLAPGETAREEELNHAFGRVQGPALADYRRGAFVGTPEELLDLCGRMMDAGVQYIIFYVPGAAYGHERMQILAEEVVSKLRS